MSRTVTINYEVFNYNELSAEAKENVKRWILEDDFRCDDFETMTNEDLKNLFNADLKVQFSLSYCQGDGLNIYGNVSAEDIFNCLDKHNAGEQLERFEDYLTEKETRTILAYQNVCSNIELKRTVTIISIQWTMKKPRNFATLTDGNLILTEISLQLKGGTQWINQHLQKYLQQLFRQ